MTSTISRPQRICACNDPSERKVRGMCKSCYNRAKHAGTIEVVPRQMHDADVIGPAYDQYRATTRMTRKEIAAVLGLSPRALDGVLCRYRKRQRDCRVEAEEASEAFEFIRSGLARGATAPPLPTADELAAWHAAGCPLGTRLAAHRERAA